MNHYTIQESADNIGVVSAELTLSKFNYALYHISRTSDQNLGLRGPLQSLVLENHGNETLENLLVTLVGDEIKTCSIHVDELPAQARLDLSSVELILDADAIYRLTEKRQSGVTVTVRQGENVLYESTAPVEVLTLDEWDATAHRATLASYVLPNHPVVEEINRRAQELLQKRTGSGSMSGYQSKDPERVKAVAEAIYDALAEKELIYCTTASSFERTGQRVRLPDRIVHDLKANCLDSSLFFAGCLEQAGIRVVLILVPGHIFIAYFTEKTALSSCADATASELQQLVSAGRLVPVEATYFCHGQNNANTPYSSAVAAAMNELDNIEYMVDVSRARTLGAVPLPITRQLTGEEGQTGSNEDDEVDEALYFPEFDGAEEEDGAKTPSEKRLRAMQRYLLPSTKASPFINLKYDKLIPICSADLNKLLKDVAAEKHFELRPYPKELGNCPIDFEAKLEGTELLIKEHAAACLTTGLKKSALEKRVKELVKTGKRDLEQFGFNSLHLCFGLLRWTDEKSENYYAPILLQPVKLVTGSKGAALAADGEMTLNPVLKLRLDRLGVKLNTHVGAPLVNTIHALKNAIIGRNNWLVLDKCVLGSFANAAFTVYMDLVNNEDYLRQHELTRSILDGQIHFDVRKSEDLTRKIDGDDIIDIGLNEEQKRIAAAVCKGASLICEGPPGCGKSQELTAVAVNAAAKGKPVLITTAQKGALDVIEDRLRKLGADPYLIRLGPNCTESVKKKMRETLEQRKRGQVSEYADKRSELERLAADQKKYAEARDKKYACGMTLRELINANIRYENVQGFALGHIPDLELLTDGHIQQQIALIRRMGAMASAMDLQHHPLRHMAIHGDPSEQREIQLKELQMLDMLKEDGVAVAMAFCEDRLPMTIGDLVRLADRLRPIAFAADEPRLRNAMKCVPDSSSGDRQIRARVESVFNPSVFRVDAAALIHRYEKARGLAKHTMVPGIMEKLNAHAKRRLSLGETMEWLELLALYQVEADDREEYCRYCREKLQKTPEEVETLSRIFLETCKNGNMEAIEKLLDDGTVKRFARCKDLSEAYYGESIDGLRARYSTYLENLDKLPEWMGWLRLKREAVDLGMDAPVEAFENNYDAETVEKAWLKAIYRKILKEIVDSKQVLKEFSANLMNHDMTLTEEATVALREVAAQELVARLDRHVPDMVSEATVSTAPNRYMTLLNDSKSSLRQLYADPEVRRLALRTCPIVLATTDMVAEVFPMDECFHVTAIEEASQVPVASAIGALARARAAMIVGDPRQLPPCSFFKETPVSDVFAESILSEAVNLNFPRIMLKEHYRSRHEDLIAFSNRAFYDSKLISFPAADDVTSHVQRVAVDGRFDHGKSRTNKEEAKAVVAELLNIYKDPERNELSVGVVTMNYQQETLIESLFETECRKDEALRVWAFERKEPVFIKNLENVQGDERDIILLSVAYSAKESGKLDLNFGPLTQAGGDRRLNVAITRAREDMKIYNSFDPELIPEDKVGDGVRALRNFLIYAKSTTRAAQPVLTADVDEVCGAIAGELALAGFEVNTLVGEGNFRVDIAVKHKDRYILGILIDRDNRNDAVLKGLGWNIYHVHSLEWKDARSDLIARLLERIDKLTAA